MNSRVSDPSCNRALVQEMAKVMLRNEGLRVSRQREELLERIFSEKKHFSAEELLERMKQDGLSISVTTVYRMLGLLVKRGFLGVLELGERTRRYDPSVLTEHPHHHVRCLDCGKLVDFSDPCLGLRERVTLAERGFEAQKIVLQSEVRCSEFRRTGKCSRYHE